MKKGIFYLHIILIFSLTSTLTAQKKLVKTSTLTAQMSPSDRLSFTGHEIFPEAEVPIIPTDWLAQYQQNVNTESDVQQEIWLGFTSYDLMTNAATKHRIHNNGGKSAGV